MPKPFTLALNALLVGALLNLTLDAQTPRMVVPGAATLPATCSAQQVIFHTTAPIGLYQCVAANTWSQLAEATGGGAPADAVYWLGASNVTLTNGKNLGALSTGLVLNTAGTPTAYGGSACTNQFVRSLNGSAVATCATVSLTADVTGLLPLANVANASAASVLLGRGSAGGAGVYQEITLGANLEISGTVLSVTGGGAGGNVTSSTAIGSEPGSPASGDVDFYTNTPQLARYSGSAWVPWGPLFKFTTPSGSFSWVNQGSATISTTGGGYTLVGEAVGNTANLNIRVETAPSTPWTRTAYFEPIFVQKGFNGYGMCFRQSSDGKMAVLNLLAFDAGLTTLAMASSKYSGATGAITVTDYVAQHAPNVIHWVRFGDNGTNRTIEISADGQNWLLFHSVARTDYMTADQVGFYVTGQNAATPNYAPILRVLSWGS
jgi:hypothetical protein